MQKSQSEIYRGMAAMLNAGIDVIEVLRLSARGDKGKWRKTAEMTAGLIKRGKSLSEAMKMNPGVFKEFDVRMVNVGEISGHLPECFCVIADWYEFKTQIKKQIMSKLMYPLFLLHVSPFIVNIPYLVRGDSGFAVYVIKSLSVLMACYLPAGAIYLLAYGKERSPQLRKIVDRAAISVPLLGRALLSTGLARFSYTFWAMYRAGMDMEACAEAATNNCGNTSLAGMMSGGIKSARLRRPVSTGFARRLPLDFISLWQAGEVSGKMEETAKYIADNMFSEAKRQFKLFAFWFSRLVEISIMLFIVSQMFQGYGQALNRVMDIPG